VSENKRTVEKYMEGFRLSDHEMILSCLTDDVEWILPGAFRLVGKEAYDAEIENPAFTGSPEILVHRLTEENDVVVAEGRVKAQQKDGTHITLAMCDVFEMRDAKICRLTSYLVSVP
jgi:uncharacterized protein